MVYSQGPTPLLSFGNLIAANLKSPKVSLIWCSDSSEENSRRKGNPLRDEPETTGLLGIRREAVAAWLDRLLSAPLLLGAKQRIAQFLPKK